MGKALNYSDMCRRVRDAIRVKRCAIGGSAWHLRRMGYNTRVVENRTRGKVVLSRVKWCRSFLCRLRGLTFRRRLPADEGLLLVEARASVAATAIHMFFVFFPIAVLWLDAQKRVVDVALARPFRPYYAPRHSAQYFVEGVPGLLDQVHVGDELDWEMR